MRHRTDKPHAGIRDDLRHAGLPVLDTSQSEIGCDLIVRAYGFVWLLEVKPERPPSARKLSKNEQRAALLFGRFYLVVSSTEDALSQMLNESRRLSGQLAA